MAKKIKCSGCATLIDIDPSLKILVCPQCGKKFKNPHYEEPAPAAPVETKVEEPKPVEKPVEPIKEETPVAEQPKVEEPKPVDAPKPAQKLAITCPACKSKVECTSEDPMIVCPTCGKSYKNILYRGPKVEAPKPVEKPAEPVKEETPIVEQPKVEDPKPVEAPVPPVEEKPADVSAPIDDDFNLDDAFGSSTKFSDEAKSVSFTKDDSASAIAASREATPIAPVVKEEPKEETKTEEFKMEEPKANADEDLSSLKDELQLDDSDENSTPAEDVAAEEPKAEKPKKEKKIKDKVVSLVSKKAANVKLASGSILMILSLVVLGIYVYNAYLEKETFLMLLKDPFDAMIAAPGIESVYSFFYGVYITLTLLLEAKYAWLFFIISTSVISCGDLLMKSVKKDVDVSNKIKGAKRAGLGIALFFALLYFLVDATQLIPAVYAIIKGSIEVLDAIKTVGHGIATTLFFDIIVIGFLSYRIDYTNKK